jgi:hypothetical protein
MRPPAVILLTAGVALLAHATLAALGIEVARLGASGSTVRAELSVRGLFAERFRRLIEDGGTLHLRIRAELWEDRAWDRLAAPALVGTWRIRPSVGGLTLTVSDPRGTENEQPLWADPMLLRLDLAPLSRLDDDMRYYVRVGLVAGTIGDRAAEDVNDAVFGREDESGGIGALGRFLFRQAVALSEYFQSETTEVTSRRVRGRDLRMPLPLAR